MKKEKELYRDFLRSKNLKLTKPRLVIMEAVFENHEHFNVDNLYEQIRKKLARAFVEGREIKIEGGFAGFEKEWFRCRNCHGVFLLKPGDEKKCPECGSKDIYNLNESVRDWQTMRRRGRWRGEAVEYCICPSCGTKVKHIFGRPCNTYICPNCGNRMVRE